MVLDNFWRYPDPYQRFLIRIRIRNAVILNQPPSVAFRHLCAGDTDFYNRLESFDCDAEAGKRGIYHRYYIQICTMYTVHCTDRGGQMWYLSQVLHSDMYTVHRTLYGQRRANVV